MKKVFSIVALLFATACVHSVAQSAIQPATTLRVQNQSFLDVNVYVIRGSSSLRLGTATGLSTTILRIPHHVLAGSTSLRFRADPIGSSREPVSEEITVTPGDEVSIMIPPL